jgi:hypothetical protein
MRSTYRTPYVIDSTLTLENYDATDYGYLRVIVNATTLTVEFHPQSDTGTTKTPNDTVSVTLATHTLTSQLAKPASIPETVREHAARHDKPAKVASHTKKTAR